MGDKQVEWKCSVERAIGETKIEFEYTCTSILGKNLTTNRVKGEIHGSSILLKVILEDEDLRDQGKAKKAFPPKTSRYK